MKKESNKRQPSPAMVQNIVDDMKKHKSYDDFLYTKGAMYKKGDSEIVTYFPREQSGDYQNAYIKNYCNNLDDEFVFIDHALYDNDYFCPRFFFDEIFSKNKNIYNGKTMTATEFIEKYPERSNDELFKILTV